MEFSLPIFVIGLLLGIFQLAVGVVFGRCLPVRRPSVRPSAAGDASRLDRLARRLYRLVSSAADDLVRHRAEISELNRELQSVELDEADDATQLVLKTVARIIEINERLQMRLSSVEEKLQQQTGQIERLAPADGAERDTALTAICEDLRHRLAEVTDEPA